MVCEISEVSMRNSTAEYENDLYAWITHNVQLLREGRLTEIDAEHIAEELESIGRSEKYQLMNHLAILFAHLLKWQYHLYTLIFILRGATKGMSH